MLELRVKTGRRHVPLFDLPTALGRKEAAREIGATVESLISFLDDLGGDPDDEDNGDALDGLESEDEFMRHSWTNGPGCHVADSGSDVSWTEWHSRGRHKLTGFGHEDPGRAASEDCEEDDDDACLAFEDDPARAVSDGYPGGDPGDLEMNGDETDYTAE